MFINQYSNLFKEGSEIEKAEKILMDCSSDNEETETCRRTTTMTRPEELSSRTGCEKSRKRRRTRSTSSASTSSSSSSTATAANLVPIYNVVRCCSTLLQRLQPSQPQRTSSADCHQQQQRHLRQHAFQQHPHPKQQLLNNNHHHHHHHHQCHQVVQQVPHISRRNSRSSCSAVFTANCLPRSSHQPTWWSLVFALVLLLSVATNTRWPAVMANPVLPTSSVPKWINPCNYDLESRSGESSAGSSSSTDGAAAAAGAGVDFHSAEARTLYDQIVSEVESTETYVNEIKHQFVEETFGDPSFIEEFEWISYEWLPKIPSGTAENFATVEVSLKNSFEYLQHFAVAIEQMTMDQMIYEGSHLDQFRTMEKRLRNVLCLLQGAMLRLRVGANPDVTRGVMSEEYRSIEMDAMRNVRDYIIMREYAHALKFVHQAFGYFQNQNVDDSTSEDS